MLVPQKRRLRIIGAINKAHREKPKAQAHAKEKEGHVPYGLFRLQEDEYPDTENKDPRQHDRYRMGVVMVIVRVE